MGSQKVSASLPKTNFDQTIFALILERSHIIPNTCQTSRISPNNLLLKYTPFIGNNKHVYSTVKIKTQKWAKTCLVINALSVAKPYFLNPLQHNTIPKHATPTPIRFPLPSSILNPSCSWPSH